MAAPRISVIMNCLNCESYLREAIDSVYAQTLGDWEIVFWDNASTDASAAIARSYDHRLRYFRGDSTVPLGHARNLALAEARGEFVAFLDCDDFWLPRKLESQMSLLASKSEAGFVYGNFFLLYEDSGTRKVARPAKLPEGQIFEKFLLDYQAGLLTVMVRRSALEHLDTLFDENFNLVEEYDLFMRILYRTQAIYVSEPLAVCRIHEKNTSTLERNGWMDEHTRVLKKLRSLDTSDRYHRAFDQLAIKLDLLSASIALWQGQPGDARALVKAHWHYSPKSFALLLLSFVPARIFLALRFFWRRGLLYR